MSFESGADYLRRLKQDQDQPVSQAHAYPPAKPAIIETPADPNERRKSPRYKCQGSAEF